MNAFNEIYYYLDYNDPSITDITEAPILKLNKKFKLNKILTFERYKCGLENMFMMLD